MHLPRITQTNLIRSTALLMALSYTGVAVHGQEMDPIVVPGSWTADDQLGLYGDRFAVLALDVVNAEKSGGISIAPTDEDLLPFQSRSSSRAHRVGMALSANLPVDFAPVAHGGKASVGSITQRKDGGVAWTLPVSSPGAVGIRVQLSDVYIPENFELYIYAIDTAEPEAHGPYTAADVLEDGTFWTNTVFAEKAFLELRSNGPASPDDFAAVRLSIAKVGHFVSSALPQPEAASEDKLASCAVTAACQSSYVNWTRDRAGIALMLYIKNDDFYACTGSLVANSAGSLIPYFLTADHCLSTQTEANTLECYFDYYAEGCGSSPPTLASRPRTATATLLADGNDASFTDFAFLRLSETPSGTRTYLGWSASPVSFGDTLYRLHHPEALPLYYQRVTSAAVRFNCLGDNSNNFIFSRQAQGATSTGSSGSAILDSQGRIRGQYLGICYTDNPVLDDCNTLSFDNADGRFANTYNRISQWVDPPPCAYSLVIPSLSFPFAGATRTFTVTTGSSCTWVASESLTWARFDVGSRTGSGTVSLTVDTNSTTWARTGSVTVAGTTYTITQEANPCIATVTAPDLSFSNQIETRQFIVAIASGCTWSASSTAAWLSFDPSQRTGPGSTSLTVEPNTTASARSALVTVAGVGYTVTQAAGESLAGYSSTWYFAEGAAFDSLETYILITNPSTTDAINVEAEFLTESGTNRSSSLSVPAQGRGTIRVNDLVQNEGVSTVLRETSGRPFASERAMYSRATNGRWYGGHSSIGIKEPQSSWYLAEGATVTAGPANRAFETYILIANPNNIAANTELTFYAQGESPIVKSFTVPANRRLTVGVNGGLDSRLVNAAFSTRITSTTANAPILVERAMWWRADNWGADGFMEGTASPALSSLSNNWYLAEGNTDGWDEFLLLVNPEATAASVTISYFPTTGSTVTRSFTLEGNARKTINVRYDAEGFGQSGRHGTRVTSTREIAVERSMYRSSGGYGWVSAHNSVASNVLARKWALPEGANVPIAYGSLRTEILLCNPGSQNINVQVKYLIQGGSSFTQTVNLGVGKALTIDTTTIPQLQGQAFSTEVTAPQPIVVERSSYWSSDTPGLIPDAGATCSMGIPIQ